jgi:hypothetical protein
MTRGIRKQPDERRAQEPDKIPRARPGQLPTEDDAVDAAIKRSIDEFGA